MSALAMIGMLEGDKVTYIASRYYNSLINTGYILKLPTPFSVMNLEKSIF